MNSDSDSVQRQLKINYLDKLFNSYVDAVKRGSLQHTFTALLSVVLVLVSVNYLTVSQGWTMAGLTFSVPQPAILIGGALLLTWRHLLVATLGLQQGMAARAIWRLYRELGLEDPTLTEELSLFDRPDGIALFVPLHSFYSSYGTQVIFLIVVAVQFSAVWVLPIAAQVFVAHRLFSSLGARWWLLSTYGVLGPLLALYYAQLIRMLIRGQGTTETSPSLSPQISGPTPSSVEPKL